MQGNAATKKSHISSAPSYDVDCSVSRVPKSRIEIHCLGENNKAAYCCCRYGRAVGTKGAGGVVVVVPFIFRIFSSFMKHYITRAQGPVIVIAKKFKLWSSIYTK